MREPPGIVESLPLFALVMTLVLLAIPLILWIGHKGKVIAVGLVLTGIALGAGLRWI